MTIAVDFDGTIVEHCYPEIGQEIPFATDTLKMLIKDHQRLILWSVREGKLLEDAINWCRERGVEFCGINIIIFHISYQHVILLSLYIKKVVDGQLQVVASY